MVELLLSPLLGFFLAIQLPGPQSDDRLAHLVGRRLPCGLLRPVGLQAQRRPEGHTHAAIVGAIQGEQAARVIVR